MKGSEKSYIEERILNQNEAKARRKYGDTVYMQEPNVKRTAAAARARLPESALDQLVSKDRTPSPPRKMVEKKLLTENERRQPRPARHYDFLHRVRTELHYLNKRGLDVC